MAPEAASTSRLALHDIHVMLPVLHKYNFTSLLAICDAQLATPGSLTADHATPGSVLKWLCLASTYQREDLLNVCRDRVQDLASDPDGLALLVRALSKSPKLIEDLAAAGQAQVIANIMAKLKKRKHS